MTQTSESTTSKKRAKLSKKDKQLRINIGNNFMFLMDKDGTSNGEMAKILNCTNAHVSALRNGRTTMNLVEIAKICQHYKISANELIPLSEIFTENDDQIETEDKEKEEKITDSLITKIKSLPLQQKNALLHFIS